MSGAGAAADAALRRLRQTLGVIAHIDPSRHGHTGPDTAELTQRYERRNTLICTALALARQAGLPAGVGHDPGDPHPVVVYIQLPTGQISWHLPAHPAGWDGHTTAGKYRRIAAFLRHNQRRNTAPFRGTDPLT